MRSLLAALVVLGLTGSPLVCAHAALVAKAEVVGLRYVTSGTILGVDEKEGSITFLHEAVPDARMPAMRMTLPVLDVLLLKDLREGDRITIIVDRTGGRGIVVALARSDQP